MTVGGWFGHNAFDDTAGSFGLNKTQALGEIFTGSLGAYYVEEKHNKAKMQKEAAKTAAQREQDRQNQILQNVQQNNEMYGYGDSAAAQNNAQQLQNFYNSLATQQEAATDKTVDQQYQDTSQTNTNTLAAQGLSGSSVDYDLQRANLNNYVSGRQQALIQGQNAARGLQQANNAQRMQIQGELEGGSMANPDWTNLQNNLNSQLTNAKADLGPNTVGSVFSTAGKLAGSTQTTDISPDGKAVRSGVSLPSGSSSGSISSN